VGPRGKNALVVSLACALVVSVPAAGAGRARGPLAGIACKRIAPGVCEESGNDTLPPNSFGSQSTDTVPSQSKGESTFLEPFNAQELADFDSMWEGVADGFPKLAGVKDVTVRRVITCALFARAAGNLYGAFTSGTMVRRVVSADNANAAVLAMCIQAAVTGQHSTGMARDAATGSRCSTALVSIPVQISRSGSRYIIHANSAVSRASRRVPLAVSCGVKGNGIVIKLRSRKRGQKLRSVLGPKFSIGYSNPTNKPVAFRATFTFS
jgi:hypothetical protein